MSQQQESLTDRLVSVISSIQRERRSGMLIAKRGEGTSLEEGIIVFVNGQITEAHAGRFRDSAVRNWLSTWENCRFLFVPASSNAEVHGSAPMLPAWRRATEQLVPGPPAHMVNTKRLEPQVPSLRGQEGHQETSQRDAPTVRVPYPIQHLEMALRLIERQGLSRVHRRLFCLIDGQRSVVDLARLTGKSGSELYRLLGDLERANTIRLT